MSNLNSVIGKLVSAGKADSPRLTRRSLSEIIPELLSKNYALTDFYPDSGKKFREASAAIISEVKTSGIIPLSGVSENRIRNGVLFATFYTPAALLFELEAEEEKLKIDGRIDGIPSGFYAGIVGLVIRYAISKDGTKMPADTRTNPKSRYNSNPAFGIGYGTDYLEFRRAKAGDPLEAIIEELLVKLLES